MASIVALVQSSSYVQIYYVLVTMNAYDVFIVALFLEQMNDTLTSLRVRLSEGWQQPMHFLHELVRHTRN
jgi:hypothetical protein